MARGSSQSQTTTSVPNNNGLRFFSVPNNNGLRFFSVPNNHISPKQQWPEVLLSRRRVGSSSSPSAASGGVGGGSSNMLRFYTDDAPGLKISPTVVLVISLCFIGFVTALHVFGKLYWTSSGNVGFEEIWKTQNAKEIVYELSDESQERKYV